jgi:hypothetical protein
MELKNISIGTSDFDKLIQNGSYYVDKTLLIKELIDNKNDVNLITRPRRFGKTLNMNMLKSFFENNRDVRDFNYARRSLFNGLKIEQAGARYWEHFARYPVIFMSFKGAGHSTFDASVFDLKGCIYDEYNRHRAILKGGAMEKDDLRRYEKILAGEATVEEYHKSIRQLSQYLYNRYKQKVVIFIDEYDVPLESAYTSGFYPEMTEFIRSLFEAALKDNPYLEFAVMTGCLRVSKESIFTGLNNLAMISITSNQYSEYFGFTQDETDKMLEYYGLTSKREETARWYDGYMFGNTEVYNPWSVTNRIKELMSNLDSFPVPYWVNSSGNAIVRSLIDKVDSESKKELEILMAGGTIIKPIHEDITYDEITSNVDNIWNFLFFTGYLKKVGERFDNENTRRFELKIPNLELRSIYIRKISEWFKTEVVADDTNRRMIEAVVTGDAEGFQSGLTKLLLKTISFYDTVENFYHGFLAGILSAAQNYSVKSNRETGNGRSNMFLKERYGAGTGMIIEIKIAKSRKELSSKCDEALQQIDEKQYVKELQADGCDEIIKYGVAFYEKQCMVKTLKSWSS